MYVAFASIKALIVRCISMAKSHRSILCIYFALRRNCSAIMMRGKK